MTCDEYMELTRAWANEPDPFKKAELGRRVAEERQETARHLEEWIKTVDWTKHNFKVALNP